MLEEIREKEWFNETIEDLKAINIEYTYLERQSRIKKYWEIGQAIRAQVPLFEQEKLFGRNIIKLVAKSINLSPRLMYDVMKFVDMYDTFEEVENLPEGKNLTWTKIVENYLRENKGSRPRKKKEPDWHICPQCGKSFVDIDEHVHSEDDERT